MPEVNEFVLSGACELASTTIGDTISVLSEGVCAKLKPDWVKFSRIGMQLLTCSQEEQEKHSDGSLPLAASSEYHTQDRRRHVFKTRADYAH